MVWFIFINERHPPDLTEKLFSAFFPSTITLQFLQSFVLCPHQFLFHRTLSLRCPLAILGSPSLVASATRRSREGSGPVVSRSLPLPPHPAYQSSGMPLSYPPIWTRFAAPSSVPGLAPLSAVTEARAGHAARWTERWLVSCFRSEGRRFAERLAAGGGVYLTAWLAGRIDPFLMGAKLPSLVS